MIHSFEYCIKREKGWGQATSLAEHIATAKSLEGVAIGEGVVFEGGEIGRVLEVSGDKTRILRLTGKEIAIGERVAATGTPLMVSCGSGVLGKVISPLGYGLTEGRDKSEETESRIIETAPLGISKRAKITRFAECGISMIDATLPLGVGQRELLLGDRKTGKTELALNMLVAQVKSGAKGVYVAIGKKTNEVLARAQWLKERGVMDEVVIVAATASASAGQNFVAPYTGMTLSEWFRDQGNDVVIVLDDLSTHAKYYREIGLAAGQFPGRESYPGDVFYAQARLLERAGNFVMDDGAERAITAIPVAEAVGADMTGYITTNLMSITDGHWFLDSELFLAGSRPAVNVFLSVTRVGRQTQPVAMRLIGESVVKALKEEAEVSRFVRFGAELSNNAQLVAGRGLRLRAVMNQESGETRPWQVSAYLVLLAWEQEVSEEMIAKIESKYREDKGWQKSLNEYLEKAKDEDSWWKSYPKLLC